MNTLPEIFDDLNARRILMAPPVLDTLTTDGSATHRVTHLQKVAKSLCLEALPTGIWLGPDTIHSRRTSRVTRIVRTIYGSQCRAITEPMAALIIGRRPAAPSCGLLRIEFGGAG